MENIECSMNKIIIFSLFIRGYIKWAGKWGKNYGFIENMYYVRMRNERK